MVLAILSASMATHNAACIAGTFCHRIQALLWGCCGGCIPWWQILWRKRGAGFSGHHHCFISIITFSFAKFEKGCLQN